ncbi:MAG: right-handed parallel beta-helix repeat-containing protein [Thermoleophilia bacterium]
MNTKTSGGYASRCQILFLGLHLLIIAAVFLVLQASTAMASTVTSNTTFHINNTVNGGDCTQIGTWDASKLTCTLTEDVTVNGADGIHIDSGGVTLDGAGYALTGNYKYTYGVNGVNGVYLKGINGVTIKGLKVGQFNNGIFLDNSGYSTLSGNTCSNNYLVGIYLYAGSNDNIVTNNVCTGNNFGIAFDFSVANTVQGNTCSNNSGDGIRVADFSNGNSLRNNTCLNNLYGIYLWESTRNSIGNNTLSLNIDSGISLDVDTASNAVWNNICSGNGGNGIELYFSSNNAVSNNNCSDNKGDGIHLDTYYYASRDTNNIFSGNFCSGNALAGINLNYSQSNTFTNNICSSNSIGIKLAYSYSNKIYHNNFINNTAQAYVDSSSIGNVFNLPAPAGGNNWSDWTSPDANSDGFVDSPYVFSGGQDNLPLTTPVANGKPSLSLVAPTPFWNSYADYVADIISVNWTVNNTGSTEAWNVQVTANTNTNGVTLASALPAAIGNGNILAGSSGSVTLMYNVPQGVVSWTSTLTVSVQDGAGYLYSYP